MPADFIHIKEAGTGTPLLLLHGTGADETQLLGLGRLLSPGAPLLSPHTLNGALLIRPMVPLEPDPLPDLRAKRVLLLAGRADPMVPAGQPEQLAALLRRAGANVELSWQNAGHELGAGDVAEAKAWLERR